MTLEASPYEIHQSSGAASDDVIQTKLVGWSFQRYFRFRSMERITSWTSCFIRQLIMLNNVSVFWII